MNACQNVQFSSLKSEGVQKYYSNLYKKGIFKLKMVEYVYSCDKKLGGQNILGSPLTKKWGGLDPPDPPPLFTPMQVHVFWQIRFRIQTDPGDDSNG